MKVSRQIEIPEDFLLTIAVYGTMGDGKLPDLMRIWAQKECDSLGLHDTLVALQKERLVELTQRMRNVLGDGPVNSILADVAKAATIIKKGMS